MEFKLKPISKSGIDKAITKAETYRYLDEPGEAESICRDILAIDPDNQSALRLLGLAITDQFTGGLSERYDEAETVFRSLTSRYEQLYYAGLLLERRAKAHSAQAACACAAGALRKRCTGVEEAGEDSPRRHDDGILRGPLRSSVQSASL